MLKLFRTTAKFHALNFLARKQCRASVRTFLSQAYYCSEVWEHRLRSPIFSKVNLEELYQDLEQRFSKTRKISAVDVDIFANAVTEETYVDELLDLVYKLRLSADTGNTLNSTSHAVVRYLTANGRNEELLKALDDRLNYGLFLDHYMANILMDTYYKNKDFSSGARIASQLMLQEDFGHALSASLSLLHCYNFLLNPSEWPEEPKQEEPEEEVKIRVKFLRNPYDDDHFDLKDALKIVGKTIWMVTRNSKDTLDKSFALVGLSLYGKTEKAKKVIDNLGTNKEKICTEILNFLPEESETRRAAAKLQSDSFNVQNILESRVKQAERQTAEKDIAVQCELFAKWEKERIEALERQTQRLMIRKRLADIDATQKDLKERETKLWFFENEEQIELEIEAKELLLSKRTLGAQKQMAEQVDEEYIPPEVHGKRSW